MEIDFLKMRACGDDVVVLNAARSAGVGTAEELPLLARRILDRRTGVGGSLLAALGTAEDGTLPVACLDPDGDPSSSSCNALRCAARYASDSGAVSAEDFQVRMGPDTRRAQIIDSANVRVDMGVPFTPEKSAQIRESLRESFVRSILVAGKSVSYTPVSLGRSYAMLFVPDFSFPIRSTARALSGQPEFPADTGVGFAQVCSREEIRLRTWDPEDVHGADECACAAAALVAAVVNGFTDREAFVRMKAGDLYIQWDERDGRIWLTGPVGYVFTGTYDYPDTRAE
jgi:diaminopimelate epimerase